MIGIVFAAFAVLIAIYGVWLTLKGDDQPDYVGWLIAAVYQVGGTLFTLAVFGFIALVVTKIVSP